MSVTERKNVVAAPGVLVVKVGTRVLTRAGGALDEDRIAALAEQLAQQCELGRQVVLVSSGAVGAGMDRLGLSQRPADVAALQAVAAAGQSRLIECYERILRRHNRHAGQVLLTAEDLSDRSRYLNVRNTLRALLALNVIPIVNENDTVAVDELVASFGDNDRLAALVATALRAPLLLILSDVAGLYDRHPDDDDARVISTVRDLESVREAVHDRQNRWSKGGMASKLNAAKMVISAGENCIVACGQEDQVITRVMAGEELGTLFLAERQALSPRKRWIGFSAKPTGRLLIDAGACRAVTLQGSSLLAVGIRRCEGAFRKGDIVSICDDAGNEVARGLANYGAAEVRQILGKRSEEIAVVLGHLPYTEVIHRDNLHPLRGSE